MTAAFVFLAALVIGGGWQGLLWLTRRIPRPARIGLGIAGVGYHIYTYVVVMTLAGCNDPGWGGIHPLPLFASPDLCVQSLPLFNLGALALYLAAQNIPQNIRRGQVLLEMFGTTSLAILAVILTSITFAYIAGAAAGQRIASSLTRRMAQTPPPASAPSP